jgi:hypothetical protein
MVNHSSSVKACTEKSLGLTHSTTYFPVCIVVGGVQTGSTGHVGHSLAYCACPRWLWGWRIWWNEWQGKPKYSEKTCPDATLSTTNPTWPDPELNLGRRGGKPATNRGQIFPYTTLQSNNSSVHTKVDSHKDVTTFASNMCTGPRAKYDWRMSGGKPQVSPSPPLMGLLSVAAVYPMSKKSLRVCHYQIVSYIIT